jgi:predicted amidohydrolase YtcJ
VKQSLVLSLALVSLACVPGGGDGAEGTARYTLYQGGHILTMEGSNPSYVEVLVREGARIVYVGDREEAETRFEGRIDEVDLAGRAMLPGFIDTHVHFSQYAQTALLDSVKPWDFEDADAFIAHVKAVADETPPGEPIFVFGYDKALIPPHRNLTREDLDEATSAHPVYVLYLNMHWGSANSMGLSQAGITRETPTEIPGGGIYFKDATGEPTGVVTESAIFFIAHLIEESLGDEAQRESMYEVARRLSANGITTATDLATGANDGAADVSLLQSMAHDEAFAVRLSATPLYQILGSLDAAIAWDGTFQANRVKLLIDASLVGGTSATMAPQLDGSTGRLSYSRDAYRQAVLEAMEKGFSTTTHTMGDRAHGLVLDVFEELDSGDDRLPGFRHSIEHSALVAEDDVSRMARLGLHVSLLMPLLHVYGDAMRDRVYGPSMAPRLFPAALLEAGGVNVSLHSDAPIFPAKPLFYAWVAVNRETTSGAVLGADQALSSYSALRGITINAARHLGLERELGSLAPGKLADLVILDRDPLEVRPEELKDVVVLATIKGGRTYFRK